MKLLVHVRLMKSRNKCNNYFPVMCINYPGCFDLSTYMTVLNILHEDCSYLATTFNMMMEKISRQVLVMPSKGHVSYKREDFPAKGIFTSLYIWYM